MSKAIGKARHPWDSSRPSPKAVKAALAKGDMEALRRALTPRQRIFAEEYVVDFNASAAAVRAGYSAKWSDRQANILLHHDGVQAYVSHLQKSTAAKELAINPDWVTSKTVGIINEATRESDKLRGLELLAKILGMLKDRTEISGPDGEAIRVEQQRMEEEISAVEKLIQHLAEKKKKTVYLGMPNG